MMDDVLEIESAKTTTTTTTKKHQRKSGKNQADINSILLPYFPELSTLNIPVGWFYKLS
jgi:hypothetical protein